MAHKLMGADFSAMLLCLAKDNTIANYTAIILQRIAKRFNVEKPVIKT